MEISIDLSLLKQIVYNDAGLVKEMLEEWKTDLLDRENKIEEAIHESNNKKIFNRLHELKSSYQMIGCQEGLRYIEKMIHNVEQSEHSVSSFMGLKEIGVKVVVEIDHYLSND